MNDLHIDLRDLEKIRKMSKAIDILISKIKNTKDHNECIDTVCSFYRMAYDNGFNAGKLEGCVKTVEKVVYTNDKYNGDRMGG